MSKYDTFYEKMKDGTIKQINPFSDVEVWCVEERKKGPALQTNSTNLTPLEKREREDYCDFCEKNFLNCTPEKIRYYLTEKGEWLTSYYPGYELISSSPAEFKTVGNLFEIVTLEYWKKNYNYEPPLYLKEWMRNYISTKEGYNHIMNVLRIKCKRLGIDFNSLTEDEKIRRVEPFFYGSHDLIISKRHYKENAKFEGELCSSGELGESKHFQYFLITIESIKRLIKQNPYIKYVSVFQNWLKPAGASFDHLHKQLVGLDEWGVQMEKEINKLKKNKNLYNEFAIEFSASEDLVIAENENAIAISEIGSIYPAISIYSKSINCRPFEHKIEEIKGMSDLVYAIHKVITSQTTCNEEWYYAPIDSSLPAPWRITIKLRVITPAGFEGNTNIFINPISPHNLKEEVCEALFVARESGEIPKSIKIDNEITRPAKALRYVENKTLKEVKI